MDSEEIKRLRNELGLSSLRLANALGVSHPLLLDWEAGRKFATRRYVVAMQELLTTPSPASRPAPESRHLASGATAGGHAQDPALLRVLHQLSTDPALLDRVNKMLTNDT